MVGTALIPVLTPLAVETVVLDNWSRGRTIEWETDKQPIIGRVDVTTDEAQPYYHGADCVVNLAASVGGYKFNAAHNHAQLMDNLALQTVPVKHAAQAGVDTFVQFSSACVYPVAPFFVDDRFFETQELTNRPYTPHGMGVPDLGYSNAKIMGEIAVRYAEQMFGYEFDSHIILRPDNIAGAWDYGDERGHVIPVLIRRMREAIEAGKGVIEIGNPDAIRSFVHAEDVAVLVADLLKATRLHPLEYTLNVGNESPVSVYKLAQVIAQIIFDGKVEVVKGSTGSLSFDRYVRNHRAVMIGYKPKYPTITDIVNEYKKYYEDGRIYLGDF